MSFKQKVKNLHTIQWLYNAIPFKKNFYSLLKTVINVPDKFQWYLRFKGNFTVKLNDSQQIKLYNPGYFIENNIFWNGIPHCWEKHSLDIWMKIAKSSSVIFDVGSNTGVYSVLAQAVNPQSEVYAFEPLQRMHKVLSTNNTINGFNIHCINKAVSSESGTATFYDIDSAIGDVTSASLSKEFKASENQKPIEVEVITLADFITANNINNIDLIKIDVESYEPQVLKGFKPFLKKFKPTILIEILTNEIGAEIEDILEEVEDYVFFDISTSEGLVKTDTLKKSAHFNYLICTKVKADEFMLS